MEGGFPEGYTYTVVGGPGAGKTIFGFQFLVNGAEKFGENGIYLTFDESSKSLTQMMKRFGLPVEKLEAEGKLVIVDASPIRMEIGKYTMKTSSSLGLPEFSIDTVLSELHAARRKIDAKRVVVDSLTSLMVQYQDTFVIRKETLSLIKSLSEVGGCTSLLLSEAGTETELGSGRRVETFLVSGVIFLHNIKRGEERVRAIEIAKMRGTKHSTRLHPFRIMDTGIKVFPEERVY
jgi:KaiC/GvpD/RAD55 family RecA-like ATPase